MRYSARYLILCVYSARHCLRLIDHGAQFVIARCREGYRQTLGQV